MKNAQLSQWLAVMEVCSCGRKFSRLTYLRRHRVCCELLRQSSHVQDCEAEEEADVPTKADMWRVVQELALRNSRLEESLEKMRRWVRRQHRKISVIEWLNENCKPSQTYRRWLHSVEVGPRQLNLVFKHGFIAGMTYILQGNLSLSDEHSLPLRSFSRKENVLFGHTDDGWVALGCDDFQSIVSHAHRGLHHAFKAWRDDNQRMINDINNNEEWHQNTSKVMGGKLPYEVSVQRIYRRLYRYLKFELKNIIQYEFTA